MKSITGRAGMAAVAFFFAACSLVQSASAAKVPPFDDINTSYARNEIIDLYYKKILTGTSRTSFSPSQSMTRAELITVLDRLLKLEPVSSPVSPYRDVAQSAWYYGWVQAAVQLELASGISGTAFAPAKGVTRQEAAVWIARALKQTDSTAVAGTIAGTTTATTFSDGSRIAAWASTSVAAVYKLGLMKGDKSGEFRPSDPITRQETAVLINRVLQNDRWTAELEADPDERIVIGWQYGQSTAQYENNILKSNVNTLSPRWYYVGATGSVTNSTDSSLIAWAKKNDRQIWAMVGNRSDQEATHQMLTHAAARNIAVSQLAAVVSKYELEGLNIDFENVGPQDRVYFTAFITQLAERLHALHAVLSLDVSPDLGTDWTEVFDYAALGKQADFMVMMGYDEHYSGSRIPGPNASLPYDRNAVNRLLDVVPGHKVILAFPFYNRDWTLKADGTASSAKYISLTDQNQMINTYALKPVWNKTLGQYTASYSKLSQQHTIWFEDGRSLIAKYNLAASENLAGVAYWYIGGESPDIWASFRNAEKFYDYSF